MKQKLGFLLISVFLFILSFDTCQDDNIYDLVNTVYTYIIVDETFPAASELDILKNTIITMTFSQEIDETTFVNAFSLTDASGTDFPITNYTVTWSTDVITGQSIVTLSNPTTDLTGDNIISLTLSSNILRSKSGNPLESDFFMSFITGSLSDSIPPNILSYTLNSTYSDTNVSGTTVYPVSEFKIQFDDTMVQSSVESNFSLTCDGTAYSASSATWSTTDTSTPVTNDTVILTFTGVPQNATCLINLTSTALDKGGNGLSNPITDLEFYSGSADGSDSYETNDTSGAATSLTVGTGRSANINPGTDIDWYSVILSAGTNYNVRLENLSANHDLELFDSDGATSLGSSTNTGTTGELINYTPSVSKTYYIKIWSPDGTSVSTTNYSILVESVSPDAYETDDTSGAANTLTVGSSSSDHTLHVTSDQDYFWFSATSGLSYTIQLNNIPFTANFDIEILDPSLAQVGLGNTTGLGVSETVTVAATSTGTHYIRVYSSSGSSQTAYSITVTASTGIDYTFTVFTVPGTANTSTTISGLNATLKNTGQSSGGVTVSWELYLSTDTTIGGGDILVGTGTSGALTAGASTTVSASGSWPSTAGTYYLLAKVTASDDTVSTNNTRSSSTTVVVSLSSAVDYDITAHTAPTSPGIAGQTFAGSPVFTIKNIGTTAGSQDITWYVYYSTVGAFNGINEVVFDSGTITGGLASNGTSSPTYSGTWPIGAPSYYILLKVVTSDDLNTSNDTDISAAITVTQSVDYAVSNVTVFGTPGENTSASGSFVVTNVGTSLGGNETYKVHLCNVSDCVTGVTYDVTIQTGLSTTTLAAGGGTETINFAGTWPVGGTAGTFVVVIMDTPDGGTGVDSANTGVTVNATYVDYAVSGVTITSSPPYYAGDTVTGSFTVTNIGTADGLATRTWTITDSASNTIVTATAIGSVITANGGSLAIGFSGTWVSGATFLRATVAADSNTSNDSSDSTTFTVSTGVVSNPTFDSPPAGTYTSTQYIALSTTTSGATIRYTTDGVTTPTSSVGTLYSTPFSLSTAGTYIVQAIAYKTSWTNSSVVSATYTITGTVSAPTMTASGMYNMTQLITISTSTTAAFIRYTIGDGSQAAPTSSTGILIIGNSGSFTVTDSGKYVVKAIAFWTNWIDSTVTEATYKMWKQETASALWSARRYHQAVVYNSKIFVMGGLDGARKNDVWSSSDGATWTSLGTAGWSARFFYQAVNFNSKIFVMGGLDSGGNQNDVWSSSDGATWTGPTTAGWSARYYHKAVVYNSKIFVMGGYSGGYLNDVWSSSDGATWTSVGTAGWSARYSYQSVVYNNKIWVLGGLDGAQLNDVWSSSDGATWVNEGTAPWSARDGHKAVVFNGKIYVMGGLDGSGLLNDVWSYQE